MNQVQLLGRLTKDPEVRYTKSNDPMAIARYTLAVNRAFKKEGEPDADFINIVAFGKRAEFAQKYFTKGQQVAVAGRIQTGSYEDKDGVRRYTTDIIVDNQYFAGAKSESKPAEQPKEYKPTDGFVPINQNDEYDDLPF